MIELAGPVPNATHISPLSLYLLDGAGRRARAQEESEFGLFVDFLKGNSVFFFSFLDQSPAWLSSREVAVGCRDSTFLLVPPGRIQFFTTRHVFLQSLYLFFLFSFTFFLSSTCVVSIFSTHCLSLWH